jgi:hypothetical protein
LNIARTNDPPFIESEFPENPKDLFPRIFKVEGNVTSAIVEPRKQSGPISTSPFAEF